MTKNPDSRPPQTGDRLVLFVAFPDMCLLDLSSPQAVFWAASRIMKNRGLAGYRCHTVSEVESWASELRQIAPTGRGSLSDRNGVDGHGT
jgi:hypothetical protein